jgi:hypothetical protein
MLDVDSAQVRENLEMESVSIIMTAAPSVVGEGTMRSERTPGRYGRKGHHHRVKRIVPGALPAYGLLRGDAPAALRKDRPGTRVHAFEATRGVTRGW